MDSNVFKRFSNVPLQNNLTSVLRRLPWSNLKKLYASFQRSHPLCQDYDTPILNGNISANGLEEEKAMRIDLWKINYQLIEIRSSHH